MNLKCHCFHMSSNFIVIPHHMVVVGCYGFMLAVCVYVHLAICCMSVSICFWTITWVNINGFSLNLVCALIMWRSGLGLLMGKISSIFDRVFQDNNLRKSQGIFTKLDMCIDVVEVWFGQISSIFDRVTCLRHDNGSCQKFAHFLLRLS